MRSKTIVTGLALAVTLGLTAQVNAAPGMAGIADIKSAASEASPVEKTYWTTNCWWHRGHRHCRQVWVGFRHPHHHHHHYYRRWW